MSKKYRYERGTQEIIDIALEIAKLDTAIDTLERHSTQILKAYLDSAVSVEMSEQFMEEMGKLKAPRTVLFDELNLLLQQNMTNP